MRKKRFDRCQIFMCSEPTASGKPEVDIRSRWCARHHPKWSGREPQLSLPEPQEPTPQKTRPNPHWIPLLCVFRPYEVVHDKKLQEERLVFSNHRCDARAPRRSRGSRSEPRYPNRFGEPLCEKHRHRAEDRRAFPGEVPAEMKEAMLEEERERETSGRDPRSLAEGRLDALPAVLELAAEGTRRMEALNAAELLLSKMSPRTTLQSTTGEKRP